MLILFRKSMNLCCTHAARLHKSAPHVLKTDFMCDDPDIENPRVGLFQQMFP